MAETYRGLTIKIGGDTSSLQKALKNTNSAISQTSFQIKKLGTVLKLDPHNVEAYNLQLGHMSNQATNTAKKMSQLRTVLTQMSDKKLILSDGTEVAFRNLAQATDAYGDSVFNVTERLAIVRDELRKLTEELGKSYNDVSSFVKQSSEVEIEKLKAAFQVSVGAIPEERLRQMFAKLPNGMLRTSEEIDKIVKSVLFMATTIKNTMGDDGLFDVGKTVRVIRDLVNNYTTGMSTTAEGLDRIGGMLDSYNEKLRESIKLEKSAQKQTETRSTTSTDEVRERTRARMEEVEAMRTAHSTMLNEQETQQNAAREQIKVLKAQAEAAESTYAANKDARNESISQKEREIAELSDEMNRLASQRGSKSILQLEEERDRLIQQQRDHVKQLKDEADDAESALEAANVQLRFAEAEPPEVRKKKRNNATEENAALERQSEITEEVVEHESQSAEIAERRVKAEKSIVDAKSKSSEIEVTDSKKLDVTSKKIDEVGDSISRLNELSMRYLDREFSTEDIGKSLTSALAILDTTERTLNSKLRDVGREAAKRYIDGDLTALQEKSIGSLVIEFRKLYEAGYDITKLDFSNMAFNSVLEQGRDVKEYFESLIRLREDAISGPSHFTDTGLTTASNNFRWINTYGQMSDELNEFIELLMKAGNIEHDEIASSIVMLKGKKKQFAELIETAEGFNSDFSLANLRNELGTAEHYLNQLRNALKLPFEESSLEDLSGFTNLKRILAEVRSEVEKTVSEVDSDARESAIQNAMATEIRKRIVNLEQYLGVLSQISNMSKKFGTKDLGNPAEHTLNIADKIFPTKTVDEVKSSVSEVEETIEESMSRIDELSMKYLGRMFSTDDLKKSLTSALALLNEARVQIAADYGELADDSARMFVDEYVNYDAITSLATGLMKLRDAGYDITQLDFSNMRFIHDLELKHDLSEYFDAFLKLREIATNEPQGEFALPFERVDIWYEISDELNEFIELMMKAGNVNRDEVVEYLNLNEKRKNSLLELIDDARLYNENFSLQSVRDELKRTSTELEDYKSILRLEAVSNRNPDAFPNLKKRIADIRHEVEKVIGEDVPNRETEITTAMQKGIRQIISDLKDYRKTLLDIIKTISIGSISDIGLNREGNGGPLNILKSISDQMLSQQVTDEVKQNADEVKDSIREVEEPLSRLDELCMKFFGRKFSADNIKSELSMIVGLINEAEHNVNFFDGALFRSAIEELEDGKFANIVTHISPYESGEYLDRLKDALIELRDVGFDLSKINLEKYFAIGFRNAMTATELLQAYIDLRDRSLDENDSNPFDGWAKSIDALSEMLPEMREYLGLLMDAGNIDGTLSLSTVFDIADDKIEEFNESIRNAIEYSRQLDMNFSLDNIASEIDNATAAYERLGIISGGLNHAATLLLNGVDISELPSRLNTGESLSKEVARYVSDVIDAIVKTSSESDDIIQKIFDVRNIASNNAKAIKDYRSALIDLNNVISKTSENTMLEQIQDTLRLRVDSFMPESMRFNPEHDRKLVEEAQRAHREMAQSAQETSDEVIEASGRQIKAEQAKQDAISQTAKVQQDSGKSESKSRESVAQSIDDETRAIAASSKEKQESAKTDRKASEEQLEYAAKIAAARKELEDAINSSFGDGGYISNITQKYIQFVDLLSNIKRDAFNNTRADATLVPTTFDELDKYINNIRDLAYSFANVSHAISECTVAQNKLTKAQQDYDDAQAAMTLTPAIEQSLNDAKDDLAKAQAALSDLVEPLSIKLKIDPKTLIENISGGEWRFKLLSSMEDMIQGKASSNAALLVLHPTIDSGSIDDAVKSVSEKMGEIGTRSTDVNERLSNLETRLLEVKSAAEAAVESGNKGELINNLEMASDILRQINDIKFTEFTQSASLGDRTLKGLTEDLVVARDNLRQALFDESNLAGVFDRIGEGLGTAFNLGLSRLQVSKEQESLVGMLNTEKAILETKRESAKTDDERLGYTTRISQLEKEISKYSGTGSNTAKEKASLTRRMNGILNDSEFTDSEREMVKRTIEMYEDLYNLRSESAKKLSDERKKERDEEYRQIAEIDTEMASKIAEMSPIRNKKNQSEDEQLQLRMLLAESLELENKRSDLVSEHQTKEAIFWAKIRDMNLAELQGVEQAEQHAETSRDGRRKKRTESTKKAAAQEISQSDEVAENDIENAQKVEEARRKVAEASENYRQKQNERVNAENSLDDDIEGIRADYDARIKAARRVSEIESEIKDKQQEVESLRSAEDDERQKAANARLAATQKEADLTQMIEQHQQAAEKGAKDIADAMAEAADGMDDATVEAIKSGKTLPYELGLMLDEAFGRMGLKDFSVEIFNNKNGNVDIDHIESVLERIGVNIGLSGDKLKEWLEPLGAAKSRFVELNTDAEHLIEASQFQDLTAEAMKTEAELKSISKAMNDMNAPSNLSRNMLDIVETVKVLDGEFSTLTSTIKSMVGLMHDLGDDSMTAMIVASDALTNSEMNVSSELENIQRQIDSFDSSEIEKFTDHTKSAKQQLADMALEAEQATTALNTERGRLDDLKSQRGIVSASIEKRKQDIAKAENDLNRVLQSLSPLARPEDSKDYKAAESVLNVLKNSLDKDRQSLSGLNDEITESIGRIAELTSAEMSASKALEMSKQRVELESLIPKLLEVKARVSEVSKAAREMAESFSASVQKNAIESMFGSDWDSVDRYVDRLMSSFKAASDRTSVFGNALKIDTDNIDLAEMKTTALNEAMASGNAAINSLNAAISRMDTDEFKALRSDALEAYGTIENAVESVSDSTSRFVLRIREAKSSFTDMISSSDFDSIRGGLLDFSLDTGGLSNEDYMKLPEQIRETREEILGLISDFGNASDLLAKLTQLKTLQDYEKQVMSIRLEMAKLVETNTDASDELDKISKKLKEGIAGDGIRDTVRDIEFFDESIKASSQRLENMKKLLNEDKSDPIVKEDTKKASLEYIGLLEDRLKLVKKAIADMGQSVDIDLALSPTLVTQLKKAQHEFDESSKKVKELEGKLQEVKQAAIITGDTSGATAEIDRLEKELEEAKNAAKGAADEIERLGDAAEFSKLNDSRAQYTAMLLAARKEMEQGYNNDKSSSDLSSAFEHAAERMADYAQRAGQKIVESANTIDSAYRDMRKTVDGTEAEFEELHNAAIKFSQTNAISADTLLTMESLGGQLGVAVDRLQEFGEVAANLDIATDISAEDIALQLGQMTNIMSDLDDTTFVNVADALVRLGNNTATTESKIMAVAERMAAIANVTSMTTPELMAWSAAIASTGQRSESAATAINNSITGIGQAVAEGGATLDQFAKIAGMSADEFKEKWKNSSSEALEAFVKGLGALTDDSTSAIAALDSVGISSVRQETALLALSQTIGNLDNALRLAKEGFNDGGDAAREAAQKSEGFSGSLAILQNNVSDLGESLGSGVLPFMHAATTALQLLTNLLNSLPASTKTVIVGFGGISAVLATILPTVDRFIKGWKNLASESMEMEGATKVLVTALSKVGNVLKVPFTALKTALTGTAAAEAEAAAGATALGGAATGAASGVGFLSAALGALGITVIIGLITVAVDWFQKWREHEDMVRDATIGLSEALDDAALNIDKYNEKIKASAKSTAELHDETEKTLKAQAEFSKTVNERWSEVETNSMAVAELAKRISDLSSKQKLNKEEQTELRAMVKAYNDETGESLEIIDATTGKLNMNTGELKKNSDAWIENAESQAAQELYIDAIKNRIKAEEEQNAVKVRLMEIDKELDEANKKSADTMGTYNSATLSNAANLGKLRDEKNKLQEDEKTLQDTIDASIELEGKFIDRMTDETKATADEKAAIEKLESALESAGDSTENYTHVSEEELIALAKSYDGNIEEMMRKLKELEDANAKAVNDAPSYQKPSDQELEAFKRENEKLYEDSKRARDDFYDKEKRLRDQYYDSRKNDLDDDYEYEKRIRDDQIDEYKKNLDEQYELEKQARDKSYEDRKREYDNAYEQEKRFRDELYDEAKNYYDKVYTEEKRKRDAAYDEAKQAYDDLYDEEKRIRDDAYDDRKDELDRWLDDYKDSLDEEVDAFEKATDERLKLMEEEYEQKKKLIEDEEEQDTSDIDARIQAIKDQTAAEEKAAKLREREEKIAEATAKRDKYSKGSKPYEKYDLELQNLLTEYANEDEKERRDEYIEYLEGMKDDVKKNADERQDILKDSYDREKEEYEARRNEEKEALQRHNEELVEIQKAANEQELETLKRTNEIELEEIKRDNDVKLEAIKQSHEDELTEIKNNIDAKLQVIKNTHEDELTVIKNSNEDKLTELKNTHDAELNEIKFHYDQTAEAYKRSKDDELTEIKRKQEEHLELLKYYHEQELLELKRHHEDELTNIKNNIDDENEAYKNGGVGALEALRAQRDEASNTIASVGDAAGTIPTKVNEAMTEAATALANGAGALVDGTNEVYRMLGLPQLPITGQQVTDAYLSAINSGLMETAKISAGTQTLNQTLTGAAQAGAEAALTTLGTILGDSSKFSGISSGIVNGLNFKMIPEDMMTKADLAMQNLSTSLTSNDPKVREAAQSFVKTFDTELTAITRVATAAGSNVPVALANELAKNGDKPTLSLKATGEGMTAILDWLDTEFKTNGENCLVGWNNGFAGVAQTAVDNARMWAEGVAEAVNKKFGVNSPSRLFAWIAEMVFAGWNKGWDSGSADSILNASDTAKDITSAMSDIELSDSFFDGFNIMSDTVVEQTKSMMDNIVDTMREREDLLQIQAERMARIMEDGFDPTLTAAFEAIDTIDTGKMRRSQAAAQSVSNVTNAPVINVTNNFSGMSIRDDTDIDRISAEFERRMRRILAAQIG